MRYPNWGKVDAMGFEFIGPGLWINKAKALSITLDEAYRKSYFAFACERPFASHVVKNKTGNWMRFKSPEAAAATVLKLNPEGGKKLNV